MQVYTYNSLDCGIEKSLQQHIERVFTFMMYLGYRIEYRITECIGQPDGTTLIRGPYRIVDRQNEVHIDEDISFAYTTYLEKIGHITPDFLFRSCLSRNLSHRFSLG